MEKAPPGFVISFVIRWRWRAANEKGAAAAQKILADAFFQNKSDHEK